MNKIKHFIHAKWIEYCIWRGKKVWGRQSIPLSASLAAKLIKANGKETDLGVVSRKCVTTAFVNFLVDQMQAESSEIGDFKFHDAGTGVGAEAIANTTLGTPWGGARVAGTQTEGATANIYRTVATITFNNTFAITEHGVFSIATAGTLMDRSLFSAINVGNGDSIQFTYEITFTAGG